MKLVSTRISGVKYLVASGVSFVRGVLFSHVLSKENGADLVVTSVTQQVDAAGAAGVAVEDSAGACPCAGIAATEPGSTAGDGAAAGCSRTALPFSFASSSAMRSFISSSSFATAEGASGSAAEGAAGVAAALVVGTEADPLSLMSNRR